MSCVWEVITLTVNLCFRYAREHIIEGDPYAGFDRHTGEIAGFHLDG